MMATNQSGSSLGYNDHSVTSNEGHASRSEGHMTALSHHETPPPLGRDEEESEEDDTAGEGADTLPPDSTSTATTDAINDPSEPIDFIETHPHVHAHCFNGDGRSSGRSIVPESHDIENWMEAMGDKRGRPIKRMKTPRAVKSERPRVPYPLQRPVAKAKYARPSPSTRKRRLSGRLMRPPQPSNASEEGDMAQADEMGEGEGRDDGFVEGIDPVSRRRNKKRPGGIHTLLPPPGGGSPPSSPSNTPVTRRRTSSRKSRLKPRSRKPSKPQLAPADISTQESTTQGPGSSESSNDTTSPEDETTPLRTAGEDILEEEGEESRSLTPNPKDPSTLSTSTNHHNVGPPRPPLPAAYLARRLDHVSDIHHHASNPSSILGLSSASKKGGGGGGYSNSDDHLFDSNGTSDTDHHSLNLPSPGKDQRWTSRRFESDPSTAPFSSETSDMDTSGNERVAATDSLVDVASNSSPPLGKRAQVKGGGNSLGGAKKGGGSGQDRRPSGSSGDEVLSKKRQAKKEVTIGRGANIPSKPLPPPVPKKVPLPASSANHRLHVQTTGSSTSSVVPKRPQQQQQAKGNVPLANHRITVSSHDNPSTGKSRSPVAGSPSRVPSTKSNHRSSIVASHDNPSTGKSRSPVAGSPSRVPSTKSNPIARPKPPAKPKPTPPPKAVAKPLPPSKLSAKAPPIKPVANHRTPAGLTGGQSSGTKQRSNQTDGDKESTVASTQVAKETLRKGQSTEVIAKVSASTGSIKAVPLPKKAIKGVGVAEQGSKKEGEGSTKPTGTSPANQATPPIYSKPSVPNKPRRLSSEKRPNLLKSSSIPTSQQQQQQQQPKKDIIAMKKNFSSPQISDSSKNPSSSEATSGLSQSPSNSPYPSPSLVHKRASPSTKHTAKLSPMLARKITSSPQLPIEPVPLPNKPKSCPMLSKKISSPVLQTRNGRNSNESSRNGKNGHNSSRNGHDSSRNGKNGKNGSVTSSANSKADVQGVALSKNKTDEGSDGDVKKGGGGGGECEDQPVLFSISEASVSDVLSSPSPPPIPARNYLTDSFEFPTSSTTTPPTTAASTPPLRGTDVAVDRKPSPRPPLLSHTSLSDSAPPSPRPRSKLGPRRPPPNPPCVSPTSPGSQSLAQQPLNATDGGKKLPPRSRSYEIIDDFDKKPANNGKEKYFGSHQNRETVADVSYAVIKHSSLRGKSATEKAEPEKQEEGGSDAKALKGNNEVKLSDNGGGRQQDGGVCSPKPNARRPPPKSPGNSNVYESIDELRKPVAARPPSTKHGHPLLAHKLSFSPPPILDDTDDAPPPLPSRPAPKLTPNLTSTNSSSSPNLLEPASYEGLVHVKDKDVQLHMPKSRDPVYDEIPEKFRKKVAQRMKRDYEEIILPDSNGGLPHLWMPSSSSSDSTSGGKEKPPPPLPCRSGSSSPSVPPPLEKRESAPSISLVTSGEKVKSRLASTSSSGKLLAVEDLRENWTATTSVMTATASGVDSGGFELPPAFRKRQARSFSTKRGQSLMFKRNSSERFNKKMKATTIDTATSNKGLVRSSSLDRLDLRMERSLRNSIHQHTGSSSEDEDDPTAVSPTASDLPKVPSNSNLYRVPRSNKKPAGPFLCPPDVEPLYQYINTAEFLREHEPRPQGNSSHYEYGPGGGEGGKKQNQLELARQLSMRTKLWCELPEVIESGVLDKLTSEERKLQEAIFEVISTEDSYLRSLDVLINHFMDDPGMNPHLPEGRRVMDKRQHHVIFSNVKEVREMSALFLEKLHGRQRESAVVRNIADIILDFADNYFDCYIRYCTNQVYQIREMQDIISNPGSVMFRDYLRRLESDKCCQNLNMQSFLLLPMQRITRLPLLILAILNRTPLDHPDHDLVEKTLRSVQKLVTACNDGARKMDRTEQLHEIHKKLDFGKLKPFPIVSVSRQLERRGTLVRLQVEHKLLGKIKIKRKPLYLFIFTDYVIVTKRKKDPKGDYIYRVKDYASKAVVEVEWLEYHPGVTFPKFGEQNPISKATYAVSTANEKHAFMMVFLDNASHKEGNYIFLAQNDTDKTRWMECLHRPDQKDDEKIYQHWDCPQVQAVYDYKAQQPDELDLDRGDVVKVYRKMADGWYEGERLRDMLWGWFPSNFTVEIENAHTRARNLRQTHKLNCTTSNALALMQSQTRPSS